MLVVAQGNLGQDAEYKVTSGGNGILKFSVAVNETWMKDGEKKERVEWVNCTGFGDRYEGVAKFLTKGKGVLVRGKLRTDKVETEKKGEFKYFTNVILDELVLLGGGAGKEESEEPARTTQGNGGKSYGSKQTSARR